MNSSGVRVETGALREHHQDMDIFVLDLALRVKALQPFPDAVVLLSRCARSTVGISGRYISSKPISPEWQAAADQKSG